IPRSGTNDGLEVIRQGFPGLDVHIQLEGDVRLLPARRVVVLGRLVQAQSKIVVRTDPLGGVDGTGLQCREDFASRHVYHGAAHAGQHFATQAGSTHLQAPEIINRIDFLVEPARSLHTGGPTCHRQHAEGLVDLFPELHTAATVQPGIHFLSIRPERQGTEELCSWYLALPIIRRAMAHFGSAARYCIEYFQRWYQLTRSVDLDRQAASAHLVDQPGETLSPNAHAREILRPGGHHLPAEFLGACACLRLAGPTFGLLIATDQSRSGQADTSRGQDLTSFHGLTSYCCCNYRVPEPCTQIL